MMSSYASKLGKLIINLLNGKFIYFSSSNFIFEQIETVLHSLGDIFS